MTGSFATPDDAERASRLARAYLGEKGTLENRATVTSPIQVNLRVRIVEMSRSLTRELGVNWQALGNIGRYGSVGLATANILSDIANAATRVGGSYQKTGPRNAFTDINATIDALSQDQLIRTLAEPNLTAMSGETASFLVGGEFPIPVANTNNTITLEFKQYGISLAFVPTVVSGDRIVLKVRPEVSALTNQGAVQLGNGNNSISIPALTVRRAETTVELGSGQSFAIAGLLQDGQRLTGPGPARLGRHPNPGRAVPFGQLRAEPNGAGDRGDALRRPPGQRPGLHRLARRQLARALRPGAHPAAAPARPWFAGRALPDTGRRRVRAAMSRLSLPLLAVAALGLAGCSVLDPLEKDGAWKPTGANASNLRAMVAVPSDLVVGRAARDSDGNQAARAVARFREDRVYSLPSSSITKIGVTGSGNAAPPAPAGP